MVRETELSVNDLVFPLFVIGGKGVKKPINSMPGNFQMSIDYLVKEASKVKELGIPAVLLFGIPDKKDEAASGAFAKDGIVQQAVRRIKDKVSDLLVITDVCLPESLKPCNIDEIIKTANEAEPKLTKLIYALIERI